MDLALLRTSYRHVVHTHPEGTDEHNLIAFEGQPGEPPRGNNLFNLSLDMSNFANQITFREYRKIDYTNYILVSNAKSIISYSPSMKSLILVYLLLHYFVL